MTLHAVLFDLDGTLLDTADEFLTVMNGLREDHGKAPLRRSEALHSVSEGAVGMLQMALGVQANDPAFAALRSAFLDRYAANIGAASPLYPGVESVLQWCAQQGLRWGIVTNKTRYLTEALLEKLALSPPPDCVVCPQDVTHGKPHPEPVLLACKRLGCAPAHTVYIGDHRRDIVSGRGAGTKTIAAAYGYLAPGEDAASWAADHVVTHSEALLDLIAQLHHARQERIRL